MFYVRTWHPFDDAWLEKDNELVQAAGRPPGFSGCDFSERELGWVVNTFDEALKLKNRLAMVEGVRVKIDEC